MSLSTVRMTEFQVEKVQSTGSRGNSNPYRISLYDGMTLGEIGLVADIMPGVANRGREAANHDSFEQQDPVGFKRLLNMFGM